MKKYTPYLLGLFCFTLQGASLLAAKQAMAPFNGDTVHFLASRFVITLAVYFILIAFRIVKVNFKGKSTKYLWAMGFANIIYFMAEATALRSCPASQASISLATVPIVTTILAVIFLKQRPKKAEIMAILMSVAGVVMINFAPGSSFVVNSGSAMIWVAVVTYSFYNIFAAKIGGNFTSTETAFSTIAITGAFYITLSLGQHLVRGTITSWFDWVFNLEGLLYLIFLAVFVGIITSIIYVKIIFLIPVTVVSGMSAWNTLVGVILGAYVLNEHISLISGVGIFVIILAVVFMALFTVGTKKPIDPQDLAQIKLHEGGEADESAPKTI